MIDRHDDELLDHAALAAHLGVNRKTVSRMVTEGRLPRPVKYGGPLRWRWGVVKEWMSAMEVLDRLEMYRSFGGQSGTFGASDGTSGPDTPNSSVKPKQPR